MKTGEAGHDTSNHHREKQEGKGMVYLTAKIQSDFSLRRLNENGFVSCVLSITQVSSDHHGNNKHWFNP